MFVEEDRRNPSEWGKVCQGGVGDSGLRGTGNYDSIPINERNE